MRKRLLRWAGIALAAALAVIWAAGELAYPARNPPQRHSGTILSAQGDATLRQACFDCHSNETRHPWYRHLPVAGLVMGQHIRQGRTELNFSLWDAMDASAHRKAIHEALEAVQEREMPMAEYRLLHPEARLAVETLATLERDAWQRYGVRGEGGEGSDEDDDRD